MHEEAPNQKPRKSPYVVTYLVIFLFMMLLNAFLIPAYLNSQIETVDYGTFLNMLEDKQLATVQLEEQQIYFANAEGKMYVTNSVPQDYLLVNRLREAGVNFGKIYHTRGPARDSVHGLDSAPASAADYWHTHQQENQQADERHDARAIP